MNLPRNRLLVAAAWEPELTRFRELVRTSDVLSSEQADPVQSTGETGVSPVFATLGVGLVDSAIGTARKMSELSPSALVFIGTCGGHALPLGSVVVASRVCLVEPSVVEGRAAFPPPVKLELDLASHRDRALHDACEAAGARSVAVATTLAVTTDDDLATRLAASGAVEHLEAYAVARACAAADVPCAIVLAVANDVGSRGREQWKASHEEASARAAEIAFAAMPAILASLRTSTTPRSPA